MPYYLDKSFAASYKSASQKIRTMTEAWVASHMFCPCCGAPRLTKLPDNMPVADMRCDSCGEIFELKSKAGRLGKKIVAGAYDVMISRIQSNNNPHLLILQYDPEHAVVTTLTLVPKFFFTPLVIEKRHPLAATAHRAGWTGCNILYEQISSQGKISLFHNGQMRSADEVCFLYAQTARLMIKDTRTRGWMLDVLNCVNEIESVEFTLENMYCFEERLQKLHRDNRCIKDKIRQQLQFLRDRGVIEFLSRRHYRKSTSLRIV